MNQESPLALCCSLLCVSLPLLPACTITDGQQSTIQVSDAGVVTRHNPGPPPTWQIEFREGDARTWVYLDGEPTLTPDGRAIAGLDATELVRIRERNAAGTRELERSSSDGPELLYDYRRDGVAAQLDEGARAWLSHVLYVVARSTAIGAKDRAEHMLWQGGPEAVILELPRLSNDQARSVFADFLLGLPELEPAQCSALAETGSASLSSDSARSSLLRRLAERHPSDSEFGQSLVRSLSRISSSSAKRELVEHYLNLRNLSAEEQQSCAALCVSIASDSERGLALRALLARAAGEEQILLAVIDAGSTIASSSEKAAVFSAVGSHAAAGPTVLERLALAAATIASESDRSALLASLAGNARADAVSLVAVVQAASSLNSSAAQALVAAAVLDRQPAAAASVLTDLAATLPGISSEDTRSRVLKHFFEVAPDDEAVLNKGIEVATTIRSSSAATTAYEALLERSELPRPSLLALAEAIRKVANPELRAHLYARLSARLLTP